MKKRIRYTYDLGSEWTHYVTVVKRVEKGEIKIVDAEGGALIEDPTESEDDEELDLDLDKLNSRLAKLQESLLSNIPKAESQKVLRERPERGIRVVNQKTIICAAKYSFSSI